MIEVDQLRSCEYLYLYDLTEPDENTLRLVVHEARAGGATRAEELLAERDETLRTILAGSRAIEHGPGCRVFVLTWGTYIGYSVLNESYASPEPRTSVGVGRLFVEYTRSTYLDYVGRATIADSNYPGPFKHWALYCLNHCVDVASVEEPVIHVTTAA